jgi:hypothetical protein
MHLLSSAPFMTRLSQRQTTGYHPQSNSVQLQITTEDSVHFSQVPRFGETKPAWQAPVRRMLDTRNATGLITEVNKHLPAMKASDTLKIRDSVLKTTTTEGKTVLNGKQVGVEVDKSGKIQLLVNEGKIHRRLLVTSSQLPKSDVDNAGWKIIPNGHKNNLPTEQEHWLDGAWPPPESTYAAAEKIEPNTDGQARGLFVQHKPLTSKQGDLFGLKTREAVVVDKNRMIWVTDAEPSGGKRWGAMQVLPFALNPGQGLHAESLIAFPGSAEDWKLAEGLKPEEKGRFQKLDHEMVMVDPKTYKAGEPAKWLGKPGKESWAVIAHKGSSNVYVMRWKISHPNSNSSFDAFALQGGNKVYTELEPKAEATTKPTTIISTIEAIPVSELLPTRTHLGDRSNSNALQNDLKALLPLLQAKLK